MKRDFEFGCHVVTRNKINAGQHILKTKAFAWIECLFNIGNGCFHCGSMPKHQINCSSCNAWFCSELCKSRKGHKGRCDTRFLTSDCHITRLVTEMITVAIKKLGNVDQVVNFYTEVNLSKEEDNFTQYAEIIRLKKLDKISHSEIARRVTKIIMASFDVNIVLQRKLFCIAMNHANCLEVNEFSEEEICTKGGGLRRYYIYDIISRFNHECLPNVETFLTKDDEMVCVAARQILPGEQLFISYLGSIEFKSDQDRKSYIKELWNFDCKCRLCNNI